MKSGIITCHDVYNYGASLQAYALVDYLSHNGIETSIINYVPKYLYHIIDLMEVDAPKWRKNAITRWIYRLYVFPYRLSFIGRYVAFKEFNKKYLPLAPKGHVEEYHKLIADQYDILICGSDQIWNSSAYQCGEDPAFYLGFANPQQKRIAYAASLGENKVSAIGEKLMLDHLPKFDAVSVREKSSVDFLMSYGIQAEWVLDPVFLIDANQWRKMKKPLQGLPKQYIFVYGYDNSQELNDAIAEANNRLGFPVVYGTDKVLKNAGPQEFLEIIDNAELVITTSFHAIAFSIILHTPFITALTQNAGLYERLDSILGLTGLRNRRYSMLHGESAWKDDAIDFSMVDSVIEVERQKSKAFLQRWLIGQ